MDKDKYLKIAQEFYDLHFKDAECGIVAGSIMRGEGHAHSDIDLVVLYGDDFEDVRRESHMYKDTPIEVFIHNRQAQNYFFESDQKRGIPTMNAMVAEGIIIGKNPDYAIRQKEYAQSILDSGPPDLTPVEFDRKRYMITDKIDDLRDPRDGGAKMAVLCNLFEVAADFYLRAQKEWSGTTKGLVKRLRQVDAEFCDHYIQAFQSGFAGDADAVIDLCEEILSPYGGWHWAGDHQKAPEDWKKHPKPQDMA